MPEVTFIRWLEINLSSDATKVVSLETSILWCACWVDSGVLCTLCRTLGGRSDKWHFALELRRDQEVGCDGIYVPLVLYEAIKPDTVRWTYDLPKDFSGYVVLLITDPLGIATQYCGYLLPNA